MSQQDIIKVLSKKNEFLSSREISRMLGITPSTTCTNLKKLISQGVISYRIVRLKPVSVFKRSIKLYGIPNQKFQKSKK